MKREYPNSPLVGVGIVVRRDDLIALIERGKEPKKGLWTLPGGLVELGESVRDAAIREVAEECGLEVELGDVVSVVDLIHKDDSGTVQYHYILIDFEATWRSGQLKAASDALDARWVAISDLDAYEIPEVTRKVIEKTLK